MEGHKAQAITCYGTTMGRFPRLTPVRPDSRSPGAGTHNRHTVCSGSSGPGWKLWLPAASVTLKTSLGDAQEERS